MGQDRTGEGGRDRMGWDRKDCLNDGESRLSMSFESISCTEDLNQRVDKDRGTDTVNEVN